MALVELTLPSLGEGITDATILKWHKNIGDHVQVDDTILDIATDKVDSEVPSNATGILKEILAPENSIAAVGSVLARIETSSEDGSSDPESIHPPKSESIEVPYVPVKEQEGTTASDTTAPNNGFFSPLVCNMAKTEGISLAELGKIKGTGKDKRLSKQDLLNYIQEKKHAAGTAIDHQVNAVSEDNKPTAMSNGSNLPQHAQKEEAKEDVQTQGNVDIIEMDRMRKLIAMNMKNSQNISATVTSFAEVDVTNIVQWRNAVKNNFEKQENTKITFTPIFMDCILKVLKKYPLLNSSVNGDKIIVKKDINLGMATALPNGNLIVPVIKQASDLNLAGLAKAVNRLADNARNGKLSPSDTQDGTFTVTNVGSFGSLTGTPIINQPQVGILAIGTIKKRPVVIETETGDTIGIRHMMILSMSYDHRIIDGALGSIFLSEVVKEMEAWDLNKEL